MEQLNKLINKLAKQGKTVEITADEDVKLLIKQRKMVDKNKEMSLSEAVAFCAFACFLGFSLLFFPRFLTRDK